MGMTVKNDTTPTNIGSKRIVSNAIVLFVRILVLTLISLYSVRIIINGLGEIDYGIYNTVIGIITTCTFISSVLALSVQRFYSFSLGKNQSDMISDVFSASTNISLIMAIVVLVIFETAGCWVIYNFLTIPDFRMAATLQAFQFALFAFILSLLQIPYTAAIFAHEDMRIYAIISTFECFSKLGAAYLMSMSSYDHLVFYSALLMAVSLLIMLCYVYIGKTRYSECKYQKVRTKGLYRRLLSFSSWTFLGTTANVGLIQGNTILLNIFFGPIMNAAFGIALQINNAFTSLNNCIVLALRPAMIKSYADNNYPYLNKLFYIGNKMLLYILIAIGIPFIVEMDVILHLWLGDQVSDTTILFARLMIIYTICMAMNLPITIVVQATGKLKQYHLPVETVTLMCVPLTALFFSLHLPAWSVFSSMIGICVISHIVRLFCLRHCYRFFSIRQYVSALCIPAIPIILIAFLFALIVHSHLRVQSITACFLTIVIATPLIIILLAYSMGISREERTIIRQFIKSKLKIS